MTRIPRRIPWLLAVGLLVVIAVITAALTDQAPESSSSWSSRPSPSSTAVPPGDMPHGDHERAERKGALGEADGALPEGVIVFDDGYPGVSKLDPGLLQALREAATDAGDDGVTFYVNSGWRSPEYQNQLFLEAVSKYGSEDEAARWVARAETSPHVSGGAIDIGQSNATTWLSEHGAGYGLCQVYENEPWHYEPRPEAMEDGCPGMYDDPSQDPRMQDGSGQGGRA
ncbi:M15 family metallopeptidase [Streptomyces sp. P17]|uniref:M15 family metallopeptidase n=1 Tax=Streptomyces sp. P17 TaxID=3074716 RepID=UPI0028F3F365|nr:M15 family metallopeptidase [Streptomyces sp. P17]MDT9695142.1 M15 family metallopeptidase [Streptomyces sp. P17]